MADVPKGRFVWYELMTTDPEAAEAFYKDVMDWGTTPFEGGPTPYTVWLNGQTPIGGLMELPPDLRSVGVPPNWTVSVSTPDVDATIARVAELGGSVRVQPMDIPMVGRFSVVADPQGAVINVFTPADHTPGTDGPFNPGEFSWHELATTDAPAAFDFYRDVFGWEKTSEFDMGPMGVYHIFGRNGVPLGGMYNKPADMPAPPHWLLYVMVKNVNDALERVKRNGGQVLNGPMEVPGGDMIAQCMDPQGAAFALHEKKS